MIVDQLFNNKKNINEGLADEFMAMAKAKGYNPRLRGTPDEERARTDAMLKQRAADRAAASAPAPIGDEERAKLQARLKELQANFDPNFEYSDDHSFWRSQHEISQQINAIKKKLAESKQNKKRQINEAWLMEDPVYRKFKKVGRYIAERKMTEKEILQVFADVEAGMTDKATGANRTFLGRGKDTAMDFAGGVADALKGVWGGLQSSVPVSAVDVAYDKATDALANLTGGEQSKVMQVIKGYRNLAKEYPKTAGLAKGAIVAIAGLATGGAGLPAIAAFVYGLDSAVKGEKLSDIALKAGGAAATAWAASKIASLVGGSQPGADAAGFDPSQMPAFDDAGNLAPGFHINPENGLPYYNGELTPTPADVAAGYGAGGAEAAAGATRFDDIVSNAIDYKIKPDDTLTQILADRKINPEAFKRLPGNEVYFGPDGNPDVIKAGATIKLPRPEDVADLNKMSWTTPDAAGGNLQRFLDDPNYYTGQYNPNNNRFSLDAATNLKQQELGRYASSDIAANRVAQDAARAGGGPELLGGPGAGDVAKTATQTGQIGQAFDSGIAPIGANGQPMRMVPMDSTASVAGSTGAKVGTLSGVTADEIARSPLYQQFYAQQIAPYGANPSAMAMQRASEIASMKARAAMAGVPIRESIKLRKLPVDQLIDKKLTVMSWALNESIGKPQGRSVHLTTRGVNVVFENIQRISEAVAATRIEPTFEPIDEYPPDPFYPAPRTTPTPAPLGPELKFGSPEDTINRSRNRSATTVPLASTPTPAPAPAPTAPVATTPTGPGRENIPDELRPDMSGGSGGYDKSKKGIFGKGLDWLDKAAGKVGGAISNIGHQLTTGVTKEKLKMNWHQAGKPTDSDQLSAWLVKQGVPIGVVNSVYTKMGLPASAEAVPGGTTAEPSAEKQVGGAQKSMPFYGTNPATGKAWTYDELQAKANAGKTPVADPIAEPAPTTGKLPQPATGKLPQPTTVGQPMNVTYGKGFEKFMKPKSATQFPSFGMAGQAPAYKTSTTVKPAANTTVPTVNPTVKTTTASLPAGGGAGVKSAAVNEPIKIGGQTLNPKNPADKAMIDKIQAQTAKVAEAIKRPVAEMLAMVETKEDIARIKQFIDQTFVKYGPMSEPAFAVRNRLIEHVTQVGAQRRREHARRS